MTTINGVDIAGYVAIDNEDGFILATGATLEAASKAARNENVYGRGGFTLYAASAAALDWIDGPLTDDDVPLRYLPGKVVVLESEPIHERCDRTLDMFAPTK